MVLANFSLNESASCLSLVVVLLSNLMNILGVSFGFLLLRAPIIFHICECCAYDPGHLQSSLSRAGFYAPVSVYIWFG